jgi:hypothetical protein
MDEFEMAFFYGDFSQLHELARQVLSENCKDTSTPEEN